MAGSFAFDTPEEVMHVLASVRSSNIDSAQKNQLRDLVLSYTNGGKDPSLKIQLEQQLTQLGIAPKATPTSLSTAIPHEFGSSRSVPLFTARRAPAPSPSVSAPPTPTPAATAAPEPAVAPAPVAKVTPVSPVTPPTPAPAATPQQPSAAAVITPTVNPAPAAPADSSSDPLRRIREIKALVNEKVGNPVNLVDIDNAVGREYMAALLDAMKKLNGGGDIATAMVRLEAAFTAVEGVVAANPTKAAAPVQPAAPTAAPAPTPAAPAATQAAAPVPRPQSSAPEVRDTGQTVPIGSSLTPQGSEDSASRWANTEIRVPISAAPVESSAVAQPQQTAPAPVASAPVQKTPAPPIPTTDSPKRTPVVSAPAATPAVDLAPTKAAGTPPPAVGSGRTIKPLSQTGEPLKSITDLPTADSLATAETGDPLFTKEVDSGLHQLLSDWILFKKSGLLGSGPKGIEHPLYQKIKDLEIPVLLAGRFDGATQETKQSITDYMNGWRYEQGIIYEQGETFEHYLRRVIRHILDLQK